MRLTLDKTQDFLKKLDSMGKSYCFYLKPVEASGLKFSKKITLKIDDVLSQENFNQALLLQGHAQNMIIIDDEKGGVDYKFIERFELLLEKTQHPYKILVLTNEIESAPLSLRLSIELSSEVMKEPESDQLGTLRDELLKYYQKLPTKDEKCLIENLPNLIKKLYKQASILPIGADGVMIELLEELLQITEAAVMGQWAARCMKWNLFVFLRRLKEFSVV